MQKDGRIHKTSSTCYRAWCQGKRNNTENNMCVVKVCVREFDILTALSTSLPCHYFCPLTRSKTVCNVMHIVPAKLCMLRFHTFLNYAVYHKKLNWNSNNFAHVISYILGASKWNDINMGHSEPFCSFKPFFNSNEISL
jgi:hypothetical protein